ncbi:NAD(P)-dependent dehydrogenase (short-subunit alcohol dehydrogenase family) [Sphingobium sp. OAS761]|uniref:SDR family NAD(P)-dependent oxidoreductase n=1 Tax=Sphingobium sp. OAS761 TaxID=2817901 RepID=UPI00209C8596|nr:SDR family NAD(P)-dependent oxidoreductase [Sphingobium sp. OAS761]MCP1472423.1 NAD(P)-dependent dehydrogenase (short-subunit alcohol dehydrogenase family) [Sphingobium sp. OAS761]
MREKMTDRVALVTGASRGLGRGIARALASGGMTVYVTGRNAGDLKAAVREVDAAGGRGIGVRCDHGNDSQVQALLDRIRQEQGRLDLLVNNAAAVDAAELTRPGPFWQKDLKLVDMIDIGLRSNYVTSYFAAPLMIETGRTLIINISFYGAVSYHFGPAYGAAKAGTDKMVHDMAIDARDTDLSIISLWPGFIRTDQLKGMSVEDLWPEIRAIVPEMETPEFTGLVILKLLDDPERKLLSGQTLIGAALGHKYGISDLDGKEPRDWSAQLGRPTVFFQGS